VDWTNLTTRTPNPPGGGEAYAVPGEYWRKLPAARLSTEFLRALTEAGYLAALIPEEYGGAGLTLSAAAANPGDGAGRGCNGAAVHAQMVHHGHHPAAWIGPAEAAIPAEDRHRRVCPPGVGVTEPTSGTDTTSWRHLRQREGDTMW